jgi:beta-lactam-binding protein with PASTA domain
VTGASVEEARRILESRGLAVETTDESSGTADPGTVLGQDPAAGERVPAQATVTLTVAAPPAPTTEPPVETPTSPGATPTATDDGTSGPAVPEGGGGLPAAADPGGADSDGFFDGTS